MTSNFIAKLYLEKDEVMEKTGDSVDDLQTWMLAKAQGKFGSVHGEILDCKTNEVIRKFRKSPPD